MDNHREIRRWKDVLKRLNKISDWKERTDVLNVLGTLYRKGSKGELTEITPITYTFLISRFSFPFSLTHSLRTRIPLPLPLSPPSSAPLHQHDRITK